MPLKYFRVKKAVFESKNPNCGQTCGQVRKMGLFNPENREEQARCVYHENARFREDLRENKRKTRVRYEPSFCQAGHSLIQWV